MVEFNYIYNTYYNYIRAIVSKITHEDGDDIAQMAFVKLSQSKYALSEHEGIAREFLKTTAKRMSITYITDKKRRSNFNLELPDDGYGLSDAQAQQDIELEVFKEQLIDFVHKKIAELPDACRQVFELYYFKNMKAKQIAQELGIAKNTVWVHLHHAREALRIEALFKKNAM
jgi:RNA polymerase sigma factor (sigma-70 family)